MALTASTPAAPAEEQNSKVSSVARACSILRAFTPDQSALTAAELIEKTRINRATLYRLLSTLEDCGFVVSDGDPLQFRLGTAVAGMADAWNSSFDIVDFARNPMHDLWQRTQETIVLFAPDGMERVCLLEMASPQALTFRRKVGHRDSMILGATGRAILAYSNVSLERIAQECATVGRSYAEITSDLEKITEQGFAASSNELIIGATAISAPVFRRGGVVVGSVGILAPEARQTGGVFKANLKMLRQTALEISDALGCGRDEYLARTTEGQRP
jgi:DNA-binding IclR family transcriptional regulator